MMWRYIYLLDCMKKKHFLVRILKVCSIVPAINLKCAMQIKFVMAKMMMIIIIISLL